MILRVSHFFQTWKFSFCSFLPKTKCDGLLGQALVLSVWSWRGRDCNDPSSSVRGAALPEVTPRLRRGGAHPAAFLVTKENLEQKKPAEPGGEETSVVPQGELCLQKHLNCAKTSWSPPGLAREVTGGETQLGACQGVRIALHPLSLMSTERYQCTVLEWGEGRA